MRDDVPCEFPAGYDGSAVLERLAQVLDPELDEPILDLGFVRSLELRSGHARVALRLPTSWCAVNFAYLMAEDVRRALLGVEGIRQVTVSLGDHCAAREIEAAVNDGRTFAEAFPDRRRELGGAPSDVPAQRVSQPPGAAVARPARRGLCAGGDLRVAGRRGSDAGRGASDPPARLCTGQVRIGRDLAALFGAPGRTRPRLQPCGTADRRPRRQAVLRGPATSPLRGHPYRARGTGGQWFILSCLVERAAPRCRWTIGAHKHGRETCTIMTGTTSL